jgi:hypothetical protein
MRHWSKSSQVSHLLCDNVLQTRYLEETLITHQLPKHCFGAQRYKGKSGIALIFLILTKSPPKNEFLPIANLKITPRE